MNRRHFLALGSLAAVGFRASAFAADLLAEIRKLPVVDTHEHLIPESTRTKEKIDFFTLAGHYAINDVISAGLPKDAETLVRDQDEGIMVTFKDHVLQRDLIVSADALALSAGFRPEDTEELAGIVKLARNQDGYFMEAHVKLRPVDTPSEGIFVCGTAHSPKLISESISQSLAAASRAATFLSQPEIISGFSGTSL